jgi:two-component system cell cycle response regulator
MKTTAVVTERARVLVVDDSAVVRAVVKSCLSAYELEEAVDGTEALRKLKTETFDVVVTDLSMPGVDGFGVLAAAKALPNAPEVVILTGAQADDIQSALKALRLGAHDFLTKPPQRPGEVSLAVEKALEKKRLRDENARLLREMEALTRTDALTGVQNRRAFDASLAMEVARTRRNGSPLSVVVFDIDHFKKVNDTYGHPAGDQVLVAFAQVLTDTLRESDVVYRFGGEEFVAILPDTPLGGAYQAADRVLDECRRRSIPVDGQTLRITASAGVATVCGPDANAKGLLAKADGALYHAKRQGRDRAAMAGTGVSASATVAPAQAAFQMAAAH